MVTAVAFQDLVLDRAAARVDPPADAVAAAAQHEPPADAAAAAQHEAPALAAQQEPSSWSRLVSSLGSTSCCSGNNQQQQQKGKGFERSRQNEMSAAARGRSCAGVRGSAGKRRRARAPPPRHIRDPRKKR